VPTTSLRRLVLLALLALAGSAHAEDFPNLRIIDYGEYVVRREVGTLDPGLGAKTLTPVATVDDPRFVNRTSRIEARLCRRFGIRFEAPNLDPVLTTRVTIRVTHPALVRPDGQSGEVDTWQSPINREPSMAGYHFEKPWELVPGTWTFAVLFGDRVLAEHSFEVVAAPGPGALAPGGCDVPVS